jgi:protein AbiQ
MKLKKLDNSFYSANTHLKQALDNINGSWDAGKIRGYGVVVIEVNELTFAIPLRSNITHSASYITANNQNRGIKKGLDFSKALLIHSPTYISNEQYGIDKDEYKKLQNKERHITHKFGKYVEKYIKATKNSDGNILRSPEYIYTTLQNYHCELGL